MQLNKNERLVLTQLIEDGRATDASIARKIGITTQAVRKIRKKLESSGIIKRYNTIIDYEAIGLKAFAIAMIKITEKGWNNFNEKIVQNCPYIIGAFKVPEGDVTHIFIYGFDSLEKLDKYFQSINQKLCGLMEIKKVHIFSNSSFLKNSPVQVLEAIIKGKEIKDPFFGIISEKI